MVGDNRYIEMGLFDSRITQLLVFLGWVLVIMLVYTLAGDLSADESFRYMWDLGLNIGTGVGNINEKDEMITLFSVFTMLSGYFMVALFYVDFISYVVGQEESMYSTSFKKLFMTGTHYSKRLERATGISRAAYAYTLTLVWLALGVVLGMVVEDQSFIVSLSYSIGMMTSTGSQQPKNEPLSNWLAGTFMLIGIPLLSISTTIFLAAQPTNYERVSSDSRVDL